jgi:hypothetical protein
MCVELTSHKKTTKMRKTKRIDIKKVSEYLDIDTTNGTAIWKKTAWKGKKAGTINSRGYIVIQIDKIQYTLHRLIYALMTKRNPRGDIDHLNGIRHDNRFENLRLGNASQNQGNSRLKTNNTSGYKGVFWEAGIQKWSARIKKNGISYWLGAFEDKIDAHKAYCKAAKKLFGKYAYTGTEITLYPAP